MTSKHEGCGCEHQERHPSWPTLEKLPIEVAEGIARRWGQSQVVVVTFDKTRVTTHVVTFGKSLEESVQAAEGGARGHAGGHRAPLGEVVWRCSLSAIDDKVQAYAREAAGKAMASLKKVFGTRWGEDVLTTCVDTAIERVPFQYAGDEPTEDDAARWGLRVMARAGVIAEEIGEELQTMSKEAAKMSKGGVA